MAPNPVRVDYDPFAEEVPRAEDGTPHIYIGGGGADKENDDQQGPSAFERNKKWSAPAPNGYLTHLEPAQEAAFQSWVKGSSIPFDPSPAADYDMRGFFQAMKGGDPAASTALNQNDGQPHFPDTFKTPYHQSFSRESRYATRDAPAWNDKDQLVDNAGNVVFDERARPDSGIPVDHDPFADAPIDEKSLDQRGAPANVRLVVGAARKPDDRLLNLRRFYPDAQPYGDDNFVFKDPRTGRKTIYNPKGLDVGDIPSVVGEGTEAAGGALAAAAATPTAVAGAIPTAGLSLATIPTAYGLGAAGSRELFDLAMKLTGQKDTRSEIERLMDAGETFGTNAIGARAGDLLGKVPRAVFGSVTRPARNINPKQALTDAANVGVNLPAGATTGNRGMQIVEHALGSTPGGASVIQQLYERALAGTKSAADDIAERFGPVKTPQGAGETLRTGAENAGERFATRRAALDEDLKNAVGATRNVAINNVAKLHDELVAELARAPKSRAAELQDGIDELAGILADAAPYAPEAVGNVAQIETRKSGALPFDVLRKIRTRIGQDLDRPDISGYRPGATGTMGRVYGALLQDIKGAAAAVGPKAQRALERHDSFVRAYRTTRAPILQKIADSGSDEEAFNYAMNAAKDGGTKLAKLRKSLTPAEWDVVAASVLSKLGRATPGQQGASGVAEAANDFSVGSFLTNWSKLAPEAKQALFGGERYKDLAPELDGLVRTIGRLKDADKMANPSGTARNLIAAAGVGAAGASLMQGDPKSDLGIFAGVPKALGILVGGVLAPRYAAKLITNPAFVRWISSTSQSVARHPDNWGTKLGQLTAIAEAEPSIRTAIYQYLDAAKGAPERGNP